MRTSSSTNVGEAKDSDKRQRAAIEGYAKATGYVIVDWFYDAAVRGSDAVPLRPGFAAMLERIAGNGVRTIIVESPDRFARDLAVQLAGHDHLKSLGVALIPATAPDHFIEDTPTAVLVRQVLGAIAQFEKASTVAKLKAARDRKIAAGEKCGGRRSYAERDPELVSLARQLLPAGSRAAAGITAPSLSRPCGGRQAYAERRTLFGIGSSFDAGGLKALRERSACIFRRAEPGCARNGRHRRAALLRHPAWRSASLPPATHHLAKMIANPRFIDLDHLTHRLLVTHRLLLQCMKEAVNPESAKDSGRYLDFSWLVGSTCLAECPGRRLSKPPPKG
jgi:DNA invertase Pin-like site-specific DNA recombinase